MKLLTIDTETAGLAPAAGTGVCDLAIACVDEDFGVYWKIESLIDPECIISPGAMGVHHTRRKWWRINRRSPSSCGNTSTRSTTLTSSLVIR